MRYRDPYYARQKLSRAPSNMNRLCWELESWGKQIRWKKPDKPFDYSIMINGTIVTDPAVESAVERIYLEFCKESASAVREQSRIRKYADDDVKQRYTHGEARRYIYKWDGLYEKYKELCRMVCPDVHVLANIAVRLCYEKYPSKNKKFLWVVAGDAIVDNIRQADIVTLPIRKDDGEYEYLGRKYTLIDVPGSQIECAKGSCRLSLDR